MDELYIKSLSPEIEYWENGNVRYITYYDRTNGQNEKIKLESFNENGNKSSDQYFKNNQENGVSVYYNEEGKIIQETTYVDGIKDGRETTYYDNGQKILEGNRKHPFNKMVGKWYGWYESGEKKYESESDDNGNGTYIEWYENGQKKEEGKITSMGGEKQIVYREDGTTITDPNEILSDSMNKTLNRTRDDYNKTSKELGLDTTFDDFLNIIRGDED